MKQKTIQWILPLLAALPGGACSGFLEASSRDEVIVQTVGAVYDQIVADLRESARLFARYPVTRGGYRVNLPSVYILLSRACLYMERWDDAVDAATNAIRTGRGLSDYTRLSTPFYLTTYDLDEVEWLHGGGMFDLSNGMTTSGFSPSAGLLALYPPGDKRLELWFAADRKSVTKKSTASVRPSNTTRLPEAYLNRAEALARKGETALALADLNELRRHRVAGHVPLATTDAGELQEAIRLELRLELCFEMHRWFDLRRYGMPAISHLYREISTSPPARFTLEARDPLYTLPVPNAMIEHNVALEQNASASGPERAGTPVNDNL